MNVRFGSQADIGDGISDVRFTSRCGNAQPHLEEMFGAFAGGICACEVSTEVGGTMATLNAAAPTCYSNSGLNLLLFLAVNMDRTVGMQLDFTSLPLDFQSGKTGSTPVGTAMKSIANATGDEFVVSVLDKCKIRKNFRFELNAAERRAR